MTGGASRSKWVALLLLGLCSGCFDSLDRDAFDVPPVEARDSMDDGGTDGVDPDDAEGDAADADRVDSGADGEAAVDDEAAEGDSTGEGDGFGDA
ncbi:MAG: hypothetical protein HY905_02720 [Deltaproteobacteria bacterium]|nr:hypothetical protein [Deltaproteobacteria bacterium]